jgi:hypothetical protein
MVMQSKGKECLCFSFSSHQPVTTWLGKDDMGNTTGNATAVKKKSKNKM